MYISSSDLREREAFIERTQTGLLDTLRQDKVIQALGGYAASIAAIAENLYIPNIKNGIVSQPEAYKSKNNTPVIAFRANEVIKADETLATMIPVQESHARMFIERWHIQAAVEVDLESYMAKVNDGLVKCVKKRNGIDLAHSYSITAGRATSSRGIFNIRSVESVSHNSNESEYERAAAFMGGPILALAMREEISLGEFNATLTHELQHSAQFQDRPVRLVNEVVLSDASNELEAYHVQALYGTAAYGFTKEESLMHRVANLIEAHRSKHASTPEPFLLTEELYNALEQDGLEPAWRLLGLRDRTD
jgi:hypothetical protein